MRYRINGKALRSYLLGLPAYHFPSLRWLPKYDWRHDTIRDFMAGLIVAIMQVPHSLGNAALAGVPAIMGLYTCVFPMFIYVFMTPAPHLTMGTSALISMVIVGPVERLTNSTSTPSNHVGDDGQYEATQVGIALALLVGMIQIGLYLLQFTRLMWLLSEVLMNAYITGAVVQATVIQAKTLLGIEAPSHSGVFRLIYAIEDLIKEFDTFNWVTCVVGISSCVVLVTYDIWLKPKWNKVSKLPFPIQLVLVIIFTSLSYFLEFEDEHGVEILGDIPQGMPQPEAPDLALLKEVLPEGFIIALISLSISISVGKMLAEKYDYVFDIGQELVAEGISITFGSFFQCLPANNTIARTLVQLSAGGQTQLTALVSSLLLILVLLFLGPLFEPLPKAVLSAIILTALRTMWLNFYDLYVYAKRDILDGVVWALTFLSTTFLNVDIGLVVGIGCNVVLALIRGFRYRVVELGLPEGVCDLDKLSKIPRSEDDRIVVRRRKYPAVRDVYPVEGVRLARMEGRFTFVNYENALDRMREILTADKDVAAVVDLSELVHMDQTAARKFVALMNLDGDKSRRVIVAPQDQVSKMLSWFDVREENVFPTLEEAVASVTTEEANRSEKSEDQEVHI